jgi:outer membrane protein
MQLETFLVRGLRTVTHGSACAIFLAVAAWAPSVHAVENAETPAVAPAAAGSALTLQQCIDLALRQSHLRVASRYGVEIAESQHRQALSAYWPQIGAKATYTMMDQDPSFVFPSSTVQIPASTVVANTPLGAIPVSTPAMSYQTGAIKVKLMDRQNLVASLQATLPLYTGGQISAIVRQSEQGVKAAQEEARRTDLRIVYDTTRYYYGSVLGRELVQISREALTRMEVTLELTENLYTKGSGKVRKTDYLRNKTVVEWLRSAVAALEGNEQLARAALVNSLGMEAESPWAPASQELPFTPDSADFAQLVGRAYASNPDWAQLEAGLQAAQAKIDGAQSGHFPKVGLFANLTRIENSYDQGLVNSDNKNSWTVGIGVELPLFNGMRTTNEVREARARLEKLKQQQFLLKDGIALQVQHFFIQLKTAQKQKASSEAASVSSEENRALNELAYREELVETKDVIEAQLTESLMKAQYRKALYDCLEARAGLDFVVGSQFGR